MGMTNTANSVDVADADATSSIDTDESDAAQDDRLAVEIGFYGSIEMDPCELWNDPADAENDDAAELIALLQRRRREQEPPRPGGG